MTLPSSFSSLLLSQRYDVLLIQHQYTRSIISYLLHTHYLTNIIPAPSLSYLPLPHLPLTNLSFSSLSPILSYFPQTLPPSHFSSSSLMFPFLLHPLIHLLSPLSTLTSHQGTSIDGPSSSSLNGRQLLTRQMEMQANLNKNPERILLE